MSISIVNVLKNSSKFSGVTFLSKIISIPKSIIIAMILGPKEFGIVGTVLLLTNYANLFPFRLGTVSVVFRELPGLIKANNEDQAIKVQNIGFTFDFIISLLIFTWLIVYAIINYEPTYSVLILFASFNFLLGKMLSYYETTYLARKRFNDVARARLYMTVLVPILSIIFIFWLKIYTLVVIPLVGTTVGIIYFINKYPIGFKFAINKNELQRMLKIGISLSLGGFLYNIFVGTIDQTVIVSFLSKEDLGLFIFAMGYVSLLVEFLRDMGRVMSPMVWESADVASSDISAFQSTKRIGVYISIIASLLMTFSQLGFILLVNIFTIKFIDSQILFFILTSQIFLESVGIIPAMILGSNRANGQNKILIATGIGVLLNISLDILAIKLGYGLIGVCIVTVATQGLTTILLYLYSKKYLSDSYLRLLDYLKLLILPYTVAFLFTILHVMIYSALTLSLTVCLSITTQLIVWILFIKLVYPDYIDVNEIYRSSKMYILKLSRKAIR